MYKPLPEEVTIKKSEIDGLGLFATRDIEKGHEFGVSHISDYRFEGGYIRTPLGGFVNHSNTPNAKLVPNTREQWRTLKSTKNILEGEEITTRYSLYRFEE